MPYVQGSVPQSAGGSPEVIDVFHSANVFVNFVNVALWNDPQSPEAAVIASINAPNYKFEVAEQEALEGDGDPANDAKVAAAQQQLVAKGIISQSELKAGANAGSNPANADTTASAAPPGSPTDPAAVTSDVDATILYQSGGKTITVKDVTKSVTFPYDVATIAPQNNIGVQEVCDNLKALVTNVWVPIKNQFPDAFMTCSFRKRDPGSPGSQHPLGMAMDIQYSKASKADYFTRAQWIRDNVPFDQFLLEYKTTGSGQPWHHLSYSRSSNRAQVCTFMNHRNCRGPGVTGLYDLSNA